MLTSCPRTSRQGAHACYSLPSQQVPEWASFYINYKGLKKLIKAAAETVRRGEKVDFAGGNSYHVCAGAADKIP